MPFHTIHEMPLFDLREWFSAAVDMAPLLGLGVLIVAPLIGGLLWLRARGERKRRQQREREATVARLMKYASAREHYYRRQAH
jgi:hypothetical protein